MPAPYSDNLYSADDSDLEVADDDLEVHLSPTDGYFQGTSSSAGGIYPPQQEYDYHQDNVTDATLPTSAGVPHVPNILVQDPSLQQSSSQKGREAKEETRLNSPAAPQRASSPAASIDDYYDGASTFANSEATPSHTTYTSNAQSSSSYTPYVPSTDSPLRTPRTHPSRNLYTHPTSLFHIPREAPPAYSPSPTSPLSSSPAEYRNYQTFNATTTMGAPEEERRLLGRRPESMGDEPYDDDVPRPLPTWKDRASKTFPWASRRTLKTVLLAALVFFTLSGFLSMLASAVIHTPSDEAPSKEPAKSYDPVTGLPIKDGPSLPNNPSQPNRPSQPGMPADAVPWRPDSTCLPTEYRFEPRVFGLSFTPDKTVGILQSTETNLPSRGFQPHVSGDLIVRRQKASSPGPAIELEVVANDEALDVGVEWDSDSQQLKIKTPQRVEWTNTRRPCITLRATIWVPENAELRSLSLGSLNLGVQIVEDLVINIKNGLEINAVSADVHTPLNPPDSYRLNSRDIVVKTISGDIMGSWPLYDSLKLTSESGDINTVINPQQALESAPRPAILEVSTSSGDITVKEPLDKAAQSSKADTVIPPRDYITNIESKSGTVHAWVAFSSVAIVSTISGDIATEFLPVYNLSLLKAVTEPELHTSTKSGDMAIKILEPLWVEIASTKESRREKPRTNPNVPVDIPTNPLPLPNIPDKLPRMPEIPFTPIPGRQWSGVWPIRRSSVDASTQTQEERAVSAQNQPPMRHLKSSHNTVSGDMRIYYPRSWEGAISAESVSGSIEVRGRDVHIDSRTGWPKSVHAHKGQYSACEASLGSVSGSQVLVVV
ncbi:hypothetical protein EsH8_II_001122 [Colletotrichum jinshuiense]